MYKPIETKITAEQKDTNMTSSSDYKMRHRQSIMSVAGTLWESCAEEPEIEQKFVKKTFIHFDVQNSEKSKVLRKRRSFSEGTPLGQTLAQRIKQDFGEEIVEVDEQV